MCSSDLMLFRYKAIFEGIAVRPLVLLTYGLSPWRNKESWIQISQWARGVHDLIFIRTYKSTLHCKHTHASFKRFLLGLHAIRSHTRPSFMLLFPISITITLSMLIARTFGAEPLTGNDKWDVYFYSFALMCILTLALLSSGLIRRIVGPIVKSEGNNQSSSDSLSPIFLLTNLHYLIAMVSAALFTQIRIAIGIPVLKTMVTRK